MNAKHKLSRTETIRDALQAARDFIAGFEGDELQEGIDGMLATIDAAQAALAAESDAVNDMEAAR